MKRILNIIILFISTLLMFINCMPTSVMVNTKFVGNNIKAKRSTTNSTNTEIRPEDSTMHLTKDKEDGTITGSMVSSGEIKMQTPLSHLPPPHTNNVEIRQQPKKRRTINPIEYNNHNNFEQESNNDNNFNFDEPQELWSNDLYDRHQNNYFTGIGDDNNNNYYKDDDSYRPNYSSFESRHNNPNYRNLEQEKLAQLRQFGLRLKRNSPLTSADLLTLLAMAEASKHYRHSDNLNGIGQNLIHNNYNGVNDYDSRIINNDKYYNNYRNIDTTNDGDIAGGDVDDDDDNNDEDNDEWWLKSVVNKPSIEYYPIQMHYNPYEKLSQLESANKSPIHFHEKYGNKDYLKGMQSSNNVYNSGGGVVDSADDNDDDLNNDNADLGEIPMGFDSRLFYAPHNEQRQQRQQRQQPQQQNTQNYYTNRYV